MEIVARFETIERERERETCERLPRSRAVTLSTSETPVLILYFLLFLENVLFVVILLRSIDWSPVRDKY